MGDDEKIKPGVREHAKSWSINFRPQACSPPCRRLGGQVAEVLPRTPWESPRNRPGLQHNTPSPRGPAPSPLGPPPLFGKPGGGVCLLLARTNEPANPWGEAPYVIHSLANRFSLCCSTAKARAREAGLCLGRVRADEATCDFAGAAATALHSGRALTLPLWAASRAHTQSASWGLELQGLDWTGRESPTPAPWVSPPGPAAAKHGCPRLGRRALPARPPGLLQPCGGKVLGGSARALMPRAFRPW